MGHSVKDDYYNFANKKKSVGAALERSELTSPLVVHSSFLSSGGRVHVIRIISDSAASLIITHHFSKLSVVILTVLWKCTVFICYCHYVVLNMMQ